ncbi:hypothetical protein C8R45DRAFT_1019992 [Mycena sanguinolenta]|nr:hypothetical protein C8R45DRAFT_1019992 [Mycena sanguinolenta]
MYGYNLPFLSAVGISLGVYMYCLFPQWSSALPTSSTHHDIVVLHPSQCRRQSVYSTPSPGRYHSHDCSIRC